MRSHLPHCLCLRPSQALITQVPGWYTSVLEPKPTRAFITHPAPHCSNTQKPRDLSESPVEDRHTHLRAFPDILQITESHGKHPSLSFRHTILPAVTQNLFDYRNLQPEICRVYPGSSQRRFTGRDFFFRQILLPIT